MELGRGWAGTDFVFSKLKPKKFGYPHFRPIFDGDEK
jgi:hypothetical protein